MSAATVAPPTGERLRVKTLASYGAIQLGINAVSTTCLVHLMFFYTDVLRLSPSRAGLVLLLGHVWDGVTDPLMGYISDRVAWKGGRRRPFFIPGAACMGIFYGLLFMPPANLTNSGLFWYMLALYIAFCTGRTVLNVPYNALAPDLTKHYDERSRLAGWRVGLMLIGDMMGGLLPIALLMTLGAQRPAFTVACGIMATIAVVCGAVGRWGTFETTVAVVRAPGAPSWSGALRAVFFPPDAPQAGWLELTWRVPLRGLRAVVAPIWSPPALILIVTFGMVVIGTGFPYTSFRYLSKYYFHDPGLDLYIMIAYQVMGLAAVPFWTWTTRRYNKKHTYQAAILGYMAVGLVVLYCTNDSRVLFLCAMAASGFFGTGIWMLPNALSPDVIEWHRAHREHTNEGGFYGTWSFMSKLAGGVSPWIVGLTLDYVGWAPDGAQSWEVLYAMLSMIAVYPWAFMGIGVILFTWYPISRAVYADMMRKLDSAAPPTDS